MALSRMEGVEWDRDAIELNGLVIGRDAGMRLSLNYYATDQGKRWDDRWVAQKELLRNELICLCK